MPQRRSVSEELTDEIRHRVTNELQPGERLPSEYQLSQELNTTRDSVRKALYVLIHEGLIESHGKTGGYWVRDIKRRTFLVTSSRHTLYRGDPDDDTVPVVTAPTTNTSVPATEIAELLGLRREEPAFTRSQLHILDGQVCGATTTYFSTATAARAPELAVAPDTDPTAILDQAGCNPTEVADDTVARMPTPQESSSWNIALGVPIIELRRIVWDINEDVLFITVTTLPADRWRLTYQFSANSLGTKNPQHRTDGE